MLKSDVLEKSVLGTCTLMCDIIISMYNLYSSSILLSTYYQRIGEDVMKIKNYSKSAQRVWHSFHVNGTFCILIAPLLILLLLLLYIHMMSY